MDFFDKIRTMPASRQIALVLGTLVILIFVLGSAYFVFLRQPDAVLFSNLRTMDAATIVAELDKKKVPYHLADGGTTILVAADKVDATRLSILSQDLPLKGAVGFELFNKSDIGLTEFAQKINYQRALQGELARTIMAIDAIDTARVHLSLPEPTIFRDDKRPPKASIALTLKPGNQLSSGAVIGIQRLVAAAVPDLDLANVVVVDGEGQVISVESEAEVSDWTSPGQHAAEVYYVDLVRQALMATYPGQDFSIGVTAAPMFSAPVASGEGDVANEAPASTADPFLRWTPEQREFQLKVRVVSAAVSDREAQQNIRVATAAAIGANPALGDEIYVSASETAMPSTGAAVGDARSTQSVAASGARTRVDSKSAEFPWPAFWYGVLGIAAIGFLFALAQVLRRAFGGRQPVRRLSEAERRDFANRFQALLEQGEANAADRL